MKSTETILRKKPLFSDYEGYLPREFYPLSGQPLGWDGMKKLQRITAKLNNFFSTENFVSIRRYAINDDYSRNQYFIEKKRGNYFEILY